MRSDIFDVIVASVAEVVPDRLSIDSTTHLLGPSAILDSVGFITLLITIEQRLDSAVDLSTSLMERGSMNEDSNPFLTVGSLTAHIGELLATRS